MHCYELNLEAIEKMIFSIFRFLHPQIREFQIVVSRPNNILTIHQWKAYLFSIQIMYKSQLKKLTRMTAFVVQGHICFYITAQSHVEVNFTIPDTLAKDISPLIKFFIGVASKSIWNPNTVFWSPDCCTMNGRNWQWNPIWLFILRHNKNKCYFSIEQ